MGRLTRLAFDLWKSRSGIRRWVTRYTTTWHWCAGCGKRFLPRDYLRLDEHYHALKSWAMYEHVVHRTSFANIAEKLKAYFGLPVFTPDVRTFKRLLSRYYEDTYQQLLGKLVGGTVVHADETEVHLQRSGKGYVQTCSEHTGSASTPTAQRYGILVTILFTSVRIEADCAGWP
jgi:hypothetical protein